MIKTFSDDLQKKVKGIVPWDLTKRRVIARKGEPAMTIGKEDKEEKDD